MDAALDWDWRPWIASKSRASIGRAVASTQLMEQTQKPGQTVIFNGVPRSGKSSVVTAIQETFDGLWMNLGVDTFMQATPERYLPGIGLRPEGELQDIELFVPVLYRAMYESIAAHSRLGLNVVVDVGHHDAYAIGRAILFDCAKRLSGLPVLFAGVRCPIEIVMERRRNTGRMPESSVDSPVPPPVRLWQHEVHIPGIYDLEIDTSTSSPSECVPMIRQHLEYAPAPSASERLATMTSQQDRAEQ
ncbi:phosphotransferase-like protein [Microcoleus sp. S28C3]|uniref:phosphotransferase-like protein n=1 Tax=Microcoleus sp. S28C3 TaxID=3055414 RepID=UPI002FD05B25